MAGCKGTLEFRKATAVHFINHRLLEQLGKLVLVTTPVLQCHPQLIKKTVNKDFNGGNFRRLLRWQAECWGDKRS